MWFHHYGHAAKLWALKPVLLKFVVFSDCFICCYKRLGQVDDCSIKTDAKYDETNVLYRILLSFANPYSSIHFPYISSIRALIRPMHVHFVYEFLTNRFCHVRKPYHKLIFNASRLDGHIRFSFQRRTLSIYIHVNVCEQSHPQLFPDPFVQYSMGQGKTIFISCPYYKRICCKTYLKKYIRFAHHVMRLLNTLKTRMIFPY